MQNITIRKAVSADAINIKACVEASYQKYVERIGKPPGPMLEDYALIVKDHQVYVAESIAVLGVLVLIKNANGLLLDNVAVHPDYQGQGLGRQLIQLAESQAAAQGFTALNLYTHELMVENIAIYQSMGYVETSRKVEHGYRRVYMQKAL